MVRRGDDPPAQAQRAGQRDQADLRAVHHLPQTQVPTGPRVRQKVCADTLCTVE